VSQNRFPARSDESPALRAETTAARNTLASGVKNRQKIRRHAERRAGEEAATKEPEGTILRFALVAVELEDREPERAKYPSFFVHEVAAEGIINKEREDTARRAALEMTFGGLGRTSEGNLIAASAKFARRQHENLAKWIPTHEKNEALLRVLRTLGVPC
jgi:hypothetical protein